MFGTVCKGLHCAGCGKGVPAFSAIVLAIVFFLVTMTTIALEIIIIGGAIVFAVILGTAAVFSGILRKGPAVVYIRTDRALYSTVKYLETGASEHLALTGGAIPELEGPSYVARHGKIISGSVDHS